MSVSLAGTVRSILKVKGRQVYSITSGASVYEALELMAEKNAGALPVIDNDKLLGVISERDYARKGILQNRMSRQTPVSEIMVSPAIVATMDSTVEECMRLMTENRIRHLPVVERDQVIGLVSIGDLVKSIITAQAEAIDRLQDYITGKYPG